MSGPNPLADPLVAATLVAASLTVLFSLWQPGLDRAAEVRPSRDPANDAGLVPLVRGPLLRRSLPLALASLALLSILLHKALPIAATVRCGWSCGVDDVEALYLLNTVVISLLAAATTARTLTLGRRLFELRRKGQRRRG